MHGPYTLFIHLLLTFFIFFILDSELLVMPTEIKMKHFFSMEAPRGVIRAAPSRTQGAILAAFHRHDMLNEDVAKGKCYYLRGNCAS